MQQDDGESTFYTLMINSIYHRIVDKFLEKRFDNIEIEFNFLQAIISGKVDFFFPLKYFFCLFK